MLVSGRDRVRGPGAILLLMWIIKRGSRKFFFNFFSSKTNGDSKRKLWSNQPSDPGVVIYACWVPSRAQLVRLWFDKKDIRGSFGQWLGSARGTLGECSGNARRMLREGKSGPRSWNAQGRKIRTPFQTQKWWLVRVWVHHSGPVVVINSSLGSGGDFVLLES